MKKIVKLKGWLMLSVLQGWVKTEKYLNSKKNVFIGKLFLFKDFLKTHSLREYYDWKNNIDKPLLTFFFENLINKILFNFFVGFGITSFLFAYGLVKLNFFLIIVNAFAFWFLVSLIGLIKE